MKKILFILVILVFILTPVFVYSYFMTQETAENLFRMGSNRIELIEEFKQPEILEPGAVITKKIQVKNTGLSECGVRVKAVFTTSDMEQLCDVDWNTEDWILKEDHYYYYREIIKPQELTSPLFTEVVIKSDTIASQIQPFDVLVYAESYEAELGEDYETVWEEFQKNKPKGND